MITTDYMVQIYVLKIVPRFGLTMSPNNVCKYVLMGILLAIAHIDANNNVTMDNINMKSSVIQHAKMIFLLIILHDSV